jgi:hypothetical protein
VNTDEREGDTTTPMTDERKREFAEKMQRMYDLHHYCVLTSVYDRKRTGDTTWLFARIRRGGGAIKLSLPTPREHEVPLDVRGCYPESYTEQMITELGATVVYDTRYDGQREGATTG